MKLLHVSDLHNRPHWFEWVAAQACSYDAVCLSGDLLDVFGTAKTSLRAQAKWTREWLRDFPGRLFVCSGNHDWWDSGGVVDNDAHGGWLDKMARPEVTVDGQGAYCGDHYIHCHAFRAPPVWPQAPAGPVGSTAPCAAGFGRNRHGRDRWERQRLPAAGRSADHRGPAALDRPVGVTSTNRNHGGASAVRPGRSIRPATNRPRSLITSSSTQRPAR
jgi:hypothetical protein